MSGRVIVFGSINLDTVLAVERLARPGETVPGLGIQTFPGGKGGNQAFAAHRAGAAVSLVGKVGDDAAGEQMLGFYRDNGLSTDFIQRSAQPTGAAFIQVERESGENNIVVVAGANADFRPADMARIAIAPGDVVVSQFEVPADAIEALFNRARALGARTVLNPAPARAISRELAVLTDDLIVNETELAFLAGDGEPIAAALTLIGRDDQRIIVTLGERGAVAVSREKSLPVEGRTVEAVDTTGAGDCFCGVYAACLAAGDGISTALRVANAAAAISVTRPGAASSMPAIAEINASLENG